MESSQHPFGLCSGSGPLLYPGRSAWILLKKVVLPLMIAGYFAWVGKQKGAVSESEGSGRQANMCSVVRDRNFGRSVVQEMILGFVVM